ncbi:hypothetical protein [Moraxella bovis]|uniref:hypothetical protein n=1 Tax=Moraxella bovis TaxID=476 RepID=UPI00300E62BA
MNASQKVNKINWLKENTPDNTCRILSNVRCLSEGVDVPALDAVLFCPLVIHKLMWCNR